MRLIMCDYGMPGQLYICAVAYFRGSLRMVHTVVARYSVHAPLSPQEGIMHL